MTDSGDTDGRTVEAGKGDSWGSVAPVRVVVSTREHVVFPNRCLNCRAPADEVRSIDARRNVVHVGVGRIDKVYRVRVPLCGRCFWRRMALGVASVALILPFVAAFLLIVYATMANRPELWVLWLVPVLILFPIWVLRRHLYNIDLRFVGVREGAFFKNGTVELWFRNRQLAAAAEYSRAPAQYFPHRRVQDERGSWWFKVLFSVLAFLCANSAWNDLVRFPQPRGMVTEPYPGARWMLRNYGTWPTIMLPAAVGVVLLVWGLWQFFRERLRWK